MTLLHTLARVLIVSGLACCVSPALSAQPLTPLSAPTSSSASPQPAEDDGRAQYPAVLSNSYVSVNLGYIDYPFSHEQLEPGHQVGSVIDCQVVGCPVATGVSFPECCQRRSVAVRRAHRPCRHLGGIRCGRDGVAPIDRSGRVGFTRDSRRTGDRPTPDHARYLSGHS